jgi:hypothetical protein
VVIARTRVALESIRNGHTPNFFPEGLVWEAFDIDIGLNVALKRVA